MNLDRAIEAIHEVFSLPAGRRGCPRGAECEAVMLSLIVVSCDGRVRRMKQIEELICLDALIDFGRIKVTTVFLSKQIGF